MVDSTGMLDPDERALWRGFLSWAQDVLANVSRDLEVHSGLSIPDVEVLGRLWDAGGRVDQHALLTSLRWSASRLSHHLTRMERRGLVHREPAGTGRRMAVVMTNTGHEVAGATFGRLASSIRRHFLDGLSEEERHVIRSVSDRDLPDTE